MADIYVYDKACEDFTNFGLVGALTPTECTFEEEANGLSEITLEHPLDDFGRFAALQRDNLLIAEVPVRTTPEIQNGAIVTSVEKWTVKPEATITKAQRTIYRKQTGSSKLKVVPGGTEVTVVQKPAEGRYKVKSRYGDGWMEPDGLNYVQAETIENKSQSIESVQPAWTVKPQIFRIYSVEKNIDSVTVSARHISYDLLYNLTTYKNEAAVSCKDALAGIMNGCVAAHEFEAYTNLEDTRAGLDWTRVNPINALLDPETGLTARYSAALVRDNWALYVLHDPGLNRGVTVEYAKNMIGLTCTENAENVVTRIIPIGETKKGEDLLLEGTAWVDSPHINDYPVPHIQELKCENCKVGTDGVTTAIARARMREQAQAVFDNGGDLPEIDMSVEFVTLGDTAEYAQYKDLDRLFLWDYVIIRHKKLDLDVTARVAAIKWDCILGRMVSMEIGKVGKTLANTGITTWQIPTGFSGSKIAGGTIGGRALQSDIISARHVQSESIYTEALQAESVTAEKLAAQAITADKIAAGAIDAISINAVKARLAEITAEDIETDELAAELARITVLICGSASFDKATIKHLVSEAMNLEYGVAGQVFIKNLAVEYAQMVGAVIGKLCIKASDGKYYLLDVGADGKVTAAETTVTDGEIEAGQTSGGSVIVETNITAANLTTTNLLATYALINKIDAARIDVDELVARKTLTDALYTSKIYGGKSLEIIVGDVSKAQSDIDNMSIGGRNLALKSENEKGPARNIQYDIAANRFIAGEYYACSVEMKSPNENSVYVYLNDDSGAGRISIPFNRRLGVKLTPDWVRYSFVYKANKDCDYPGKDGLIVLRVYGVAADDADILVRKCKLEKGNKATDWTPALEDTDGKIDNAQTAADNAQTTANGAQTAADNAQTAADAAQSTADSANKLALSANTGVQRMNEYVQIKEDGTHMRARDTDNEMVLSSQGVEINVGGQNYSQFGAMYVQFGNYQLRRTADGGLAFKLRVQGGE